MNTYQTFKSGPRKGQPKTLTDRVVRFLVEGLRFIEAPSKNRYRKFVSKSADSIYWVGKNGAVRSGKAVAGSISLSDRIKTHMELWEVGTNDPSQIAHYRE